MRVIIALNISLIIKGLWFPLSFLARSELIYCVPQIWQKQAKPFSSGEKECWDKFLSSFKNISLEKFLSYLLYTVFGFNLGYYIFRANDITLS